MVFEPLVALPVALPVADHPIIVPHLVSVIVVLPVVSSNTLDTSEFAPPVNNNILYIIYYIYNRTIKVIKEQ